MPRTKISVTKRQNNTASLKWQLSSSVWFVVIAIFAGLGYVAGVYHYQIEAVIGPVFGYKSHSGTIDLSPLEKTYNTLAGNYDGKLNVDKLIQGASKGMVSAVGDDYTVYMTADEATEYQNDLAGNIGGGIGAEVNLKNDKITIIRVLDNNPAKTAGLRSNDTVLEINDQSTDKMTVDEAISLIRGEEGTTVKLSILRENIVKDYTITRAIINNPSVESVVKDGIGIITISRFDNEAGDLARIAAQSFIKQNVKGVILDLRDNGGGYVNAARDTAGLWLNDKLIVTEKTGSLTIDKVYTSDRAILNGLPTVVIVNESSASASEIVAGALQDYDTALIVGKKTFGKGSVQELIDLPGGAKLKVTIAKWYTPMNKNINQEGITPDQIVNLTPKDYDNNVDPQMDKAMSILIK